MFLEFIVFFRILYLPLTKTIITVNHSDIPTATFRSPKHGYPFGPILNPNVLDQLLASAKLTWLFSFPDWCSKFSNSFARMSFKGFSK